MIQLENVSKTYQTDKVETIALHDINLLIDKGEFVSIMGPSGCGKSTLLNLLGLLDRPGEGKIKIAGEELHQWGDKALAKMRNKTFGFIFQSFHLINDLRVIDNVELPLLYRKTSAKQRRELAEQALASVGLSARMEHYPNQLSGGQQQRVAIVRSLCQPFQWLILDEPFSHLDEQNSLKCLSMIDKECSKQKAGFVLTSLDDDSRFPYDYELKL